MVHLESLIQVLCARMLPQTRLLRKKTEAICKLFAHTTYYSHGHCSNPAAKVPGTLRWTVAMMQLTVAVVYLFGRRTN